MKKKHREITDYDDNDTTVYINRAKSMTLKDLGLKLPLATPTQVVSIRLPTALLNRLKAFASAQDVPYQALIKIFLSRCLKRSNIS